MSFQNAVHKLARDKGWYDNVDLQSPDWVSKCIANMHCEISEGLAAVAKNEPYFYWAANEVKTTSKPEGLGIELADVVIRMLDFLAARDHRIELEDFVGPQARAPYSHKGKVETPMQIASYIAKLHFQCAHCADSLGNVYLSDCKILLREIAWLAKTLGIDLENMLNIKHSYNLGRPYRHGGKSL